MYVCMYIYIGPLEPGTGRASSVSGMRTYQYATEATAGAYCLLMENGEQRRTRARKMPDRLVAGWKRRKEKRVSKEKGERSGSSRDEGSAEGRKGMAGVGRGRQRSTRAMARSRRGMVWRKTHFLWRWRWTRGTYKACMLRKIMPSTGHASNTRYEIGGM